MKKIILYTMIATLAFPFVINAQELTIPVITKPALLEEGTQRELTAAQIAELLPWAKDSKIFLNDLLSSIQGLSSADKLDRLIEGIGGVVGESGPKNSELLMRYALNRGLVVDKILSQETVADTVGSIDARVRVLISSINMAIKYYDTDMATLSRKATAPYVTFGVEYFDFLTVLNKSIFDASAQYNIMRTSLEWLQWDLYRDLSSASFAPQIVKINNSLKIFPTKKLSDSQSIAYIRQMKSLSKQLMDNDTFKEILPDESPDTSPDQVPVEDVKVDNGIHALNDPTFDGIYLSSRSNIHGVCRMLGYQKGLEGTTTFNGSVLGSILIIDSKGEILGAEIATRETGSRISKLTCLNKIGRPAKSRIEKVKNVTIQNNIIFSSRSNSQGVCKLMGYRGAVVGSSVFDGSVRGSMIVVDRDGNITSGEIATSQHGSKISEVICVKK